MSKGLGIFWDRRLLAFQIWEKTYFMDKHIMNSNLEEEEEEILQSLWIMIVLPEMLESQTC